MKSFLKKLGIFLLKNVIGFLLFYAATLLFFYGDFIRITGTPTIKLLTICWIALIAYVVLFILFVPIIIVTVFAFGLLIIPGLIFVSYVGEMSLLLPQKILRESVYSFGVTGKGQWVVGASYLLIMLLMYNITIRGGDDGGDSKEEKDPDPDPGKDETPDLPKPRFQIPDPTPGNFSKN